MNNTEDLPNLRQHMNLLFDFYGSLLTEKQADCFAMRYGQDYSLSEIAQELEISPQAVVDFLKRGTDSLERYEKHLELVKKFQDRRIIAENTSIILDKLTQNPDSIELAKSLKHTINELTQI